VVGAAVVVGAASVVVGATVVVGTGSTISVLLLHVEANSTNARTRPHDLLWYTTTMLRTDQQPCQNGLTDWGYLPDQWQLANAAYPLFL
jgi:hypothetical protein